MIVETQTPEQAGGVPGGGTPVLEMRGIRKTFAGMRALSDVSFAAYGGEHRRQARTVAGERGRCAKGVAARLRLVDRRGSGPTRLRALVRYLACWIGPALALQGYAALQPTSHARNAIAFIALNYCWAIVDPDHQFLHDRIAGTLVARDDG